MLKTMVDNFGFFHSHFYSPSFSPHFLLSILIAILWSSSEVWGEKLEFFAGENNQNIYSVSIETEYSCVLEILIPSDLILH